MARLFTSGYELNTTTDGVEWTTNSVTGTTIDSTIKRTGGYSLKINLTSGQRSGTVMQYVASADAGPHYARAYYYFTTLPTAESRVMSFKSGSSSISAADRVYVTVDSSGNVKLYDEDGLIDTHTTTVTTSVWYRFELGIDLTGAGGADICQFRLDGSQIGATNRNISTNPLAFAVGGNFNSETVTGVWYIDDVAINSSSGSYENTWVGSGRVAILWPNAAGDNAMGTRGGTDSGTNYGQVSSYNDASYYVLDANSDIVDFNVTAPTDAGISSGDRIKCIQVGYRVRDSATSGASASRARIKGQASGTVSQGTALGDLGSSFNTNATADPKNYQLTSYVNPQDSLYWEYDDITNMQIGYIATDADPDVWISALWAYVDFNSPPTVSLSTPSDAGTITDTTPDLVFTGTDTEADDIRYHVQVDTVNTFNSQTSTISLDAISSGRNSTGTITVSHTTGTGKNKMLIAVSSVQDGNHANYPVTSILYAGIPLTKLRHDEPAGNVRTEIWYLVDPPTGTANCVKTTTGSVGESTLGVVTLFGVKQEAPEANNGATGTSVTPSVSLTTVADNAWSITVAAAEGTFSSINNSQTGLTSYPLTDQSYENTHAGRRSITPAGATTLSYTIGSSQVWAISAVSLAPALAPLVDKISADDTGFSGSPDNTDPFTSSQEVTHTIQSALSDTTTYYWRVRGRDPSGGNNNGSWSSTRSFYVDTGGAPATVVKDLIGMGFIPFAR